MDSWSTSGTNKRGVDDDDMSTSDDMLTGDAISSRWLARNAQLRHQVPGSPSTGTQQSSQNTRPAARMGFALDVPPRGCLAGAKASLCSCGETVQAETALTAADPFTTTACVQRSFGMAHTAGTARFLSRVAAPDGLDVQLWGPGGSLADAHGSGRPGHLPELLHPGQPVVDAIDRSWWRGRESAGSPRSPEGHL
jgi:hypothetical protein